MRELVDGCAADAAADRGDDLLPIGVRWSMDNRSMRERSKTDESLPAESRKCVGFRRASVGAVEAVHDTHVVVRSDLANDCDRIRAERTGNLVARCRLQSASCPQAKDRPAAGPAEFSWHRH